MTPIQVHLIINHAPIFFALSTLFVFALAFVFKREDWRWIGISIALLSTLATPLAFLSGEATEELVEGLPWASEERIEQHEDAAKIALALAGIQGLIAGSLLWAAQKNNWNRAPNAKGTGALITASALTLVASAYAGHTGGKLRHTEIDADRAMEERININEIEEIETGP